ncbi:MaoC family dehydratase N-terminal domain-containing protein [Dermabacteraceae bacterium TAE3-ERU27]|nr:MaoC family dehydratase N-terminal domain-containing protein [Dermabacteraceae bacterium TAE3-ERU27]
MQLNPEYAGKIYPPLPAWRVSAAKVREFALATGITQQVCLDEEAARAAGYPSLLAPPTFLVSLAQEAEAQYIQDPAAGIDFSRVVHGEESFRLERPVCAGDLLRAELKVEKARNVRGHGMVTTAVTFTDPEGDTVAVVRSSLIVRGEEG